MYFKQIVAEGLGCYSYIIGCPGAKVAAVVDPRRDIQIYLDIAREEGMKITHIIETHLHADHVSGNQELQARTGADIYWHEGTPIEYPHKTLKEGDVIELGAAKIEVLHTPGHTPHAQSLLITDKLRGDEPWMILTGDLLFVGDVGRPDLAGAEILDDQVENLYNSLYVKLGKLPDRLEVFPAHGQGSLCGRGMSSKGSSTLGFERLANPALQYPSKEEFKKAYLGDFPVRPRSFTHIIATNAHGAPMLDCCPLEKAMDAHEFKRFHDKGAQIIDSRDAAAYGGLHIPGSMNIGLEKSMANWVGMVVDPKADLLLVVDNPASYDAMVRELHRIGYDQILGYLHGGVSAWVMAGLPVERMEQISIAEVHDNIVNGDGGRVLDVRTPAERKGGYLRDSEFMPLTDVLDGKYQGDKSEPLTVYCGSGYRSNIVASQLKKEGYAKVRSMAGGVFAWSNAGYPLAG